MFWFFGISSTLSWPTAASNSSFHLKCPFRPLCYQKVAYRPTVNKTGAEIVWYTQGGSHAEAKQRLLASFCVPSDAGHAKSMYATHWHFLPKIGSFHYSWAPSAVQRWLGSQKKQVAWYIFESVWLIFNIFWDPWNFLSWGWSPN
jgi:hypothetical protein